MADAIGSVFVLRKSGKCHTLKSCIQDTKRIEPLERKSSKHIKVVLQTCNTVVKAWCREWTKKPHDQRLRFQVCCVKRKGLSVLHSQVSFPLPATARQSEEIR